MNASIDEPTIPPAMRRPLAAVWISLGLHAAVIALVQVAPPAAMSLGEPVIEARLVPAHTPPPALETPPSPATEAETSDAAPEKVPLLAPSETAEALPVAKPAAALPDQPEPPAVVARPAETTPRQQPASAQPAAPVPFATITSSVDLTYYRARDLDVHPRALREILPDYPPDADRRQLSGKVRLMLKLDADGRVVDVEVLSANPPDMFEDSAMRALRAARFSPAQKAGSPVRALVQIEVVYDWEGHALVQSRVQYKKEE